MRPTVFLFACICGRAHGDEQFAYLIDGEWMHRVIAGNRYSTQDRLGLAGGPRLTILELITDDLVVDLGIEPILVEPNASTAMRAFGGSRTEAPVNVCMGHSIDVLKD